MGYLALNQYDYSWNLTVGRPLKMARRPFSRLAVLLGRSAFLNEVWSWLLTSHVEKSFLRHFENDFSFVTSYAIEGCFRDLNINANEYIFNNPDI